MLTSHYKIFAIHEIFVGFWLCSSILHMFTSTYLESRFNKRSSMATVRKAFTYISCFAEFFMLYFYFRHNNHCEPYIYSYFCLCEYTVILVNSFYHMIAPPMLKYPIKFFKNFKAQHFKENINQEDSQRLLT